MQGYDTPLSRSRARRNYSLMHVCVIWEPNEYNEQSVKTCIHIEIQITRRKMLFCFTQHNFNKLTSYFQYKLDKLIFKKKCNYKSTAICVVLFIFLKVFNEGEIARANGGTGMAK